ncbi:MAG: hypothetical protein P8Y21_14665, partial [Gemmatimonadales bacterium]
MNRTRGAVCRFGITAMAGAFLAIGHPLVAPRSVLAQQVEPTTVLRVPVGNSSVVMHGAVLDRVSIGNP